MIWYSPELDEICVVTCKMFSYSEQYGAQIEWQYQNETQFLDYAWYFVGVV